MASVTLRERPLAELKKMLRDEFPDVKTSHLAEALARSLNFQTNAALLAAMRTAPEEKFWCLDTQRMVTRLAELGYERDPEFDFEVMLVGLQPVEGLVSTECTRAYEYDYRTPRLKAWRNLMVCAVNAGLEQGHFSLRPGDNRFKDDVRSYGSMYDFTLPNGLPARGYVSDAGFEELSIRAAVNPKGDAVRAYGSGFRAGDVYGDCWLERRRGAWMQSSTDSFRCRKHLVQTLAGLDAEPQGFGDRGRVIM